jgi:hypothetical protein
MKNRISILLVVTMTILAVVGLSSLMTGCTTNGDGSAPTTQQPKEHRDDPDAFDDERATFEVEDLDKED